MTSLLPTSFYDRETAVVARELLGKRLVRMTKHGVTTGRIVETEAYLASNDPACHAAKGRNRKNAPMFGPPGLAYVYVIHARFCFNVVTLSSAHPSAVLIRAVEPLAGAALMQKRRNRTNQRDLARGPGRLCEAFAIDRELNHYDLSKRGKIWIDDRLSNPVFPGDIGVSPRIGVTSGENLLLRFYYANCRFVSGPQKGNR